MSYNVGDLVAEFLAACGVTTVFGIVSVHNIPMLDGIGRRNAIRFVMGRGELGASHMADGYARVTGGLGVLFSSTGPGAANAVAGLVEAGFAATPVLHITGQTGSKYIGRGMGTAHEVPDQLGMLRAVSKAAFHIHSAQAALGDPDAGGGDRADRAAGAGGGNPESTCSARRSSGRPGWTRCG